MPVQLSTPKPALSSASHEQSVATLIPRDGGTLADLNGFGIHWKIDGLETGKRFSVVHHPIAPRHLAFTSLNAGRAVMGRKAKAGEQPEGLGETRVWILPSPSPLAANHWDIAPWKALAKAVRAEG